jgi:membrane protease YdiL (CAAX protease family)
MLRGIYSQLNNFSKFILLITLVFSFLLFSLLLGILVLVPFYGTGIISILASPNYSEPAVITAMKVMQILNMVGGLLLPAIVYLWLCSPKEKKYSGLLKSVSPIAVFLTFILIVLIQPIIGWASELNSHLVLPKFLAFIEEWMKSKEEIGAQVTEAFLSSTSVNSLLINILMVAILPAFAEEILFRGALAGLFKAWTKNVHLAVFLSAFIFAAIHMQFYGFLPRFLLGTALGYLYFWSGSLWLPIVAHFTNNFLSVIVEFLFRKGMIQTNAENFGVDNATWLIVISIIGVTGILFSIYNLTSRQNKEG